MTTKNPKITINPSEEIVKKANQVEIVVAGGMSIGLKKPGVLRQFQIVEVVGESAKNDVYMAMINPMLWIVSIDEDDIPPIGSKLELESLISRLGEDGVHAVMLHVMKTDKKSEDKVDSIKN